MNNDNQKQPTHKPKNSGKRILKILLWTCASVLLLVMLLLGSIVWILSPERLTPIVEKYANEYLNAQVNVENVELTFWKTFPQLRVDVDSLTIVSDNFAKLPDSERNALPANADTLLSLKHFHGGVSTIALLAGKIEIYDVELRRPMVNLVQYNDSLTNFDIIPASGPDTTTAQPTGTIPDLAIDRFLITDARPFTYTSVRDSINVGITLGTTFIDGNEAPQYHIALNGDAKALLPPTIIESDVPVGFNGKVAWSPQNPFVIDLNDFTIDLAEVHSTLNSSFDLNNAPTITSLDFKIHSLPIADVIKHIPAEYNHAALQQIKTDLKLNTSITLLEPYTVTDSLLPMLNVAVDLPKGHLQFGNKHKPLTIATSVAAKINGHNLNSSVVTIKSLTVNGVSIDIALDGTITSLLNDPFINANFKGGLHFDNFPPLILDRLPGEIHGYLTANTSLRLRPSQLSGSGFHKVKVSGDATLENFSYADSTTDFYTRKTIFKFGTNSSFVAGEHSIDSLLTASVKIDTARILFSGSLLTIKNFKTGIGCKNIASSTDSTQVNPMGGNIIVERLNFRASDSSRVRLHDIKCFASLQRFKNSSKLPRLNLAIDAKRINYGDKMNRMNLREGNLKITAHIKNRQKMSARMQARYDSISKLHPDLAPDSIYRIAQVSMRQNRSKRVEPATDKEITDFGLDNSTRSLLRRWNVHGTIKAKRGRIFTPYFPLRNTLKNVDIDFSTDSLTLNNVSYTVGKSDFLINGSVKNISRALTSRRGTPLLLDFSVKSDTIDVNQLAEAIFTGAAFAEKTAGTNIDLKEIENEDSIQAAIEQMQDTTVSAAVLIPTNIEANIRLRAHNIIYADMLMKRMRGIIMMKEGALNMHKLTASTDIGTIGLSALYTAPSKKDLSFGFGLQIKDLQLNRFINMIPAVDSLMPMLKNFEGIIDADIAATTDVDTAMNLVLPSLNAAIKLHGDSLVLLDADTFKSLSKWLMFKNKKRNMIDNMTVEILVENSMLELFPFMFDIDRYRLGVMGSNDMAFNFNYHVSVLKSPLPFKFGLTVTGNADDMKVRLGKAKFKEKMVGERIAIVDTTRVNLLNQIENVFRRGVTTARLGNLNIDRSKAQQGIESFDAANDTISHSDSLLLIKEGILPTPPEPMRDNSEKNK